MLIDLADLAAQADLRIKMLTQMFRWLTGLGQFGPGRKRVEHLAQRLTRSIGASTVAADHKFQAG